MSPYLRRQKLKTRLYNGRKTTNRKKKSKEEWHTWKAQDRKQSYIRHETDLDARLRDWSFTRIGILIFVHCIELCLVYRIEHCACLSVLKYMIWRYVEREIDSGYFHWTVTDWLTGHFGSTGGNQQSVFDISKASTIVCFTLLQWLWSFYYGGTRWNIGRKWFAEDNATVSVHFIKHFIISNPCLFIYLFSGSGQEVGRSCHLMEYKGKRIMVSLGHSIKILISMCFNDYGVRSLCMPNSH